MLEVGVGMAEECEITGFKVSTIKVSIGGGKVLIHRKTGKPIHLVAVKVRTEKIICDCGGTHSVPIFEYRPAKWYKPENIQETIKPPQDYFLPVYS